MLKGQLDEKIRKNRLLEKELEPSQKEIDEKAMEDAEYVWRKLREIFLRYANTDGRIVIALGYNTNQRDSFSSYERVYYRIGNELSCRKLGSRRMRYIARTQKFVRQIAADNGIALTGRSFEGVGFWHCITGPWDEFTYFLDE